MSSFEKGYGALKSLMLMGERFDGLERRIAVVSDDLSALARSQVRLSERVAEIEGYLRAATGAPYSQNPRLGRE